MKAAERVEARQWAGGPSPGARIAGSWLRADVVRSSPKWREDRDRRVRQLQCLRGGEAGVGAFENVLGGEEGLHNDILIDERWHVAGRGGVRSLGRGFGDPSGVVARVESGIDLEGFFGAPAGKGLDRPRWAAGGEKGASEASAEAVEAVPVCFGHGKDAAEQVFEEGVDGNVRHKTHKQGKARRERAA